MDGVGAILFGSIIELFFILYLVVLVGKGEILFIIKNTSEHLIGYIKC